jgi:hypothetical protein
VLFLFHRSNRVARFRTGHLSSVDEEHSGRTTQVTIPENMDAINSMILSGQRIICHKDRRPWWYPKKEWAILFMRF